jgi:hypothetical protein
MADPKDPAKVIKNPDLHLVSDDDLIDELEARHTCFLLWAEKSDGKEGTIRRRRHRGDVSRLLGASERQYRKMVRIADRTDDAD